MHVLNKGNPEQVLQYISKSIMGTTTTTTMFTDMRYESGPCGDFCFFQLFQFSLSDAEVLLDCPEGLSPTSQHWQEPNTGREEEEEEGVGGLEPDQH